MYCARYEHVIFKTAQALTYYKIAEPGSAIYNQEQYVDLLKSLAGNKNEAVSTLSEYVKLSDSLTQRKISLNLAEMEAVFQTRNKQQQIEVQKTQLSFAYKQKKEQAAALVKQKAEQKLNNATNSAVEKADSMITGKRRDPKAGKSNSGNETAEPAPGNTPADNNQSGGEIEKNYKEVTIKTNIRCKTGKKNWKQYCEIQMA